MIREFRRGERLSVELLNERLVRPLRALSQLRLGPGLEGRIDERSGLLLRLSKRLGEWGTIGKIVTVHGPTPPDYPSLYTYDVRALDGQFSMVNATPAYGRQEENDGCRVWPARVGQLCWIWRNPQADGTFVGELELFTENVARGPCEEEGGLTGFGDGGDPLTAELDRLRARVAALEGAARRPWWRFW